MKTFYFDRDEGVLYDANHPIGHFSWDEAERYAFDHNGHMEVLP